MLFRSLEIWLTNDQWLLKQDDWQTKFPQYDWVKAIETKIDSEKDLDSAIVFGVIPLLTYQEIEPVQGSQLPVTNTYLMTTFPANFDELYAFRPGLEIWAFTSGYLVEKGSDIQDIVANRFKGQIPPNCKKICQTVAYSKVK